MRPVTTALLLDMDDTLIDTKAAMVAAGAVAVARLWPEAGDDAHHAAGVHFHGDPGGFFGRFTTGELSFAEMRKARVVDLVDAFSFRAIDDARDRRPRRCLRRRRDQRHSWIREAGSQGVSPCLRAAAGSPQRDALCW